MITVAALYVEEGGVYYGLEGVDPWPESRDARKYAGPHPVVAHPPCARWCRLAGFVEKTHGYKKGDDAGCFAAAFHAVREFGGVLEHPAFSAAFDAHGIDIPLRGGWQRSLDGGWVCHVEQWHYGHRAKKATWLYAFGVSWLPSLEWRTTPDTATVAFVSDGGGGFKDESKRPDRERRDVTNVGGRLRRRDVASVSWCGNKTKNGGENRKRLGDKEAKRTPVAFRDLLLSIARSSRP